MRIIDWSSDVCSSYLIAWSMHMPPANLPNITAFFLQRRSGLDPGSGRPQGRRVWLTMNDPLKEQTRSVDQLSRVVTALAVDRDIKDTPGLFGGARSEKRSVGKECVSTVI